MNFILRYTLQFQYASNAFYITTSN